MLKEQAMRPAARVRSEERGQPMSRPPVDRHILLGVSHSSNDPARHRTFEVRAALDAEFGGWTARFGEKNPNAQLEGWGTRLMDGDTPRVFTTAASCLGSAVTSIVAMVEGDADDWS
jgi:hypothetical protein